MRDKERKRNKFLVDLRNEGQSARLAAVLRIMKFPLIHTGRRFFFFTFVVEGRMPVLSRLVRGAKRPVLLPAGERIVEVWRGLHRIEPSFAASDFVVMPDHVHLLFIVNSPDSLGMRSTDF